MMILPVYEHDIDRRSGKCRGRFKAGKAAANDRHFRPTRLVHDRLPEIQRHHLDGPSTNPPLSVDTRPAAYAS